MNVLASWSSWVTPLLAQGQAPAGGADLFLRYAFPFVMIGVLFYFLIIRPDQRKRAETSRMQESLKKNDRIITIGGIRGVVTNATKGSDEVTIRVDEDNNTKLHIQRSAILRILDDGGNDGSDK